MDITKAKKVVELTKGERKILVTVYEGGQVSSCIEDETKKKYCETCQADDETCQQWIEHLKEKGYEATEIELGELKLEESLPKFLEQREVTPKLQDAPEADVEIITQQRHVVFEPQEESTKEPEVSQEAPVPGEE